MSDEETKTDIEKIDVKIEWLQERLNKFRRIKQLVLEAQERGSKVDVVGYDNSPELTIIIRDDEVTREMIELEDMKISNDNILYYPDDEEYKIDLMFYVDR